MSKTTLITAPAVEPLTYAEMKTHLRLDIDTEQSYLEGLIAAARIDAEAECRRALITQTWELYLDRFPAEIIVPFAPLQSVTSINYLDTAGNSQLLAGTEYQVDDKKEPGRITPAASKSWPSTQASTVNTVTVRFVAGYGDAGVDVPSDLIHAMKFMVAHWYAFRQPVITDGTPRVLPDAADRLMWHHKLLEVA